MFKSIRFGWTILAILVCWATVCPADDYLTAARNLLVSLEEYRAANPTAGNASSPTAPAFEDLEAELARPRYLAADNLRAIVSKLRKNLPAGDAAAGRIADRIEELANRLDIKSQDWPDYCRKLAARTAAEAPVDLAAERKELARQVERFDRQLTAFPAALRGGWENYLFWSETKALSTAKEPADAAALDRLEIRWLNAPLSWDNASLTATALGVERFIRAARRAQDPRSPADWAALLRRFADALEELEKSKSADERFLSLAADLERNGMAEELIAAVRRRYSYPNAVLIFSAKNIDRRFGQSLDEPFDVNDYFAGALSRGSGRLTGTLSWAAVPSPCVARWQWRFEAESRSRSSSTSQGVQVGSQGTTEIHGSKLFAWKAAGIAAQPASTDASSTVNFESIDADGRARRQNVAAGEVYASRPQSERDASALAERSTDSRLDDEGRRLMKDLNAAYERGFKQTAATSANYVSTVITRSAETEYQWLCFSGRPESFAAPSPAPRELPAADLRMELHRSFVEGLLASRLCGKNSTAGDFSLDAAAKDDSSVADDWQIQWASEMPLSCEFAEGEMKLELHIKTFTTADGVFPGVVVRAAYRPEAQSQGMTLVRAGALSVSLQGREGEKLSGRQMVLRQTLRRRIERVLGPRIAIGEEELRKIVGSAIKMKIVELKCAEGWLMADIELKKPPESPRAAEINK